MKGARAVGCPTRTAMNHWLPEVRFDRFAWGLLGLIASLAITFGAPLSANAQAASGANASSFAWILDQSSGVAYRVSDHSWRGNVEFARGRPAGYSPQQIRHAYGVDQLLNQGDGQIIGIPDAYDYPTAAADLQYFSRTFHLRLMYGMPGAPSCTVAAGPHPCFQTSFAAGTRPAVDGGWALESSLDIEWAHAIAPGADILLVEAQTSELGDLLAATDAAVAAGAAVVSMSWGVPEGPPEAVFDTHFNVAGRSFVAAAGDVGNTVPYPSASPYVLSVGGTTLHLDSQGNRTAPETAWADSGGGISTYEPEPGYQSSFPIPPTGGFRGTPDVSWVADSNTGLAVYDTTPLTPGSTNVGWSVLGGTSIATPQWAGLTALADQVRHALGTAVGISTNDLNHRGEYDAARPLFYPYTYHDITSGSNGTCGFVCNAGPGYDFVTGLGTPIANSLVPFLALDVVH